jgi:hypothetical protein
MCPRGAARDGSVGGASWLLRTRWRRLVLSDAGDRLADGAAASRWGPRTAGRRPEGEARRRRGGPLLRPIISKVAANTLAGSRPRRRRARRRRRVHDIVLVHPARRRPVLNRCARARTASLPGRSRTGRDRRDRHDRGRAAALRSSRRARLPSRERERPRRPERGRSRQPAARRELRDNTPLHASTATSGFPGGASTRAGSRWPASPTAARPRSLLPMTAAPRLRGPGGGDPLGS